MNFIEITDNKKVSEKVSFNYKLIVIGDSGIGKSNFISKFLGNQFKSESVSTIGCELFSKLFEVTYFHENKIRRDIVKANIWDTAGQEKYKSVTSSYYKGSNGVFVLYDTTKMDTFKNTDDWIGDVFSYCNKIPSVILVGTKSDLTSLKAISSNDVKLKCEKYKILSIETSAKTDENINEAFYELLQDIHMKTVISNGHDSQSNRNIYNFQYDNKNEFSSSKGCCSTN